MTELFHVVTTRTTLTTGKCSTVTIDETKYRIQGGGTIGFELTFNEDHSYQLLALPTLDARADIESELLTRGCQDTFTQNTVSSPWGGLAAPMFITAPPVLDLKEVSGTQESNKRDD